MGNLGHTGYGHYREHYVKCTDGKFVLDKKWKAKKDGPCDHR